MSQAMREEPSGVEVSEAHRRFYEGALDLLGEEGFGGLKLTRLCRRLGLTTGAFYHSFTSWPDFTEQLLEYWYRERTLETGARMLDEPDAHRRLDVLIAAALQLRHRAESGIRVWAGIDPRVRAVQERVDRERVEIVAEAFLGVTGDADYSQRLARAAFYVLIGYEQLSAVQDPDTLVWALRVVRGLAVGPPQLPAE